MSVVKGEPQLTLQQINTHHTPEPNKPNVETKYLNVETE